MEKIIISWALANVLIISAQAQQSGMSAAQASLVSAERQFASTALAKNIKTAFMQVLDENAVVFRPHPVNGRWAYATDARPDSAYLFWQPEFVDVSMGGDFGYSTGPWYARRSKNTMEGRRGFGNFVTIWRKDKKGAWKVVLDKGIGYSQAGERSILLSMNEANPVNKKSIDISEIIILDSKSFAGKEVPLFAKTALLLENGKWPFRPGPDSVSSRYAGYESWEPINGAVASYGDMAYTYGKFTGMINTKKQEGYYLRIWKRDQLDIWHIVLDLRTEN